MFDLTHGWIFFLFGITITVTGFLIAFMIAANVIKKEKEDEEQRKKPKIFNDTW